MKPDTLAYVKKELYKLVPIIRSYSDCMEVFTIYTTLRVVVSNMVHDNTICTGYTHEDEVRKMQKYITFLNHLKDYSKDDHFIQFICAEVYMIYMGNDMAEYEEYIDDRNGGNIMID